MNIVSQLILKVSNRILGAHLKNQKRKLSNKDFSIICNNCIAGVLLKDLNQKFNTPTIDLYFFAPDYVRFLERLDYFLNKEIIISHSSKYFQEPRNYPVGKIDDIEIHFLHYQSLMEAETKWNKRKTRVNFNNLFIIGSDRENCDRQVIKQFLELPFKNKVFFSSKKISAKEVIFYPEYKNDNQVGDLIKDGYAWYFHFDIVHWLNTGKIKKNPIIGYIFRLNRRLKNNFT